MDEPEVLAPVDVHGDALDATSVDATARVTSVRALLRAASGSFGLNVWNTAATVLTTIALARLMTLDAFGTYSWVVATVYLLTVPAILGVDRLIVREVAVYVSRGEHGHVRGLLRRSIQLVLATCAAIVALVAVALLVFGGASSPDTNTALMIGVLALPALSLAWVGQSALMGLHHVVQGQTPELFLRPGLLLGAVAIAALAVTGTISAPLAASLFTITAYVAAVLALVMLWQRMRASVPTAAPVFETRTWLAGAFALVLLSGALFINSQIGVVLLGFLNDPESAGLYAVAQRGAMLVAFPLLALNAALAPSAARLWAARNLPQLQRLTTIGARAVLLVSLPIAIVFIVAGEPLLRIVFGAPFAAAALPLAILSLGQLANAATGSVTTLLMMTGNQRRAAYGIGAGLALNLGLGIALIPGYGATGAAIAAATGLIVSNVIHTFIARSSLGVDPTAIGLAPRAPKAAE